MGFLERAAKGFSADGNKDLLNSPGNTLEWLGARRRRRDKSVGRLMADFEGYVYKAIDIKATNVARVPFYTEQLVGGSWQRKEHAGMRVLLNGQDSSPSQTWMRTGTTVYKQMFGEAFWYVNVMQASRKPFDRLLLYPNRIQIITDTNGLVVGYKYTTDKGQIVPLDADEIVHFKYFNPQNHLRGIGPLQAAGMYVDAERNTMEYVANFIDNNATPSGIVVLPATTAKEQFDSFSENWKSRYGGLKNAGKTAILAADGVDYKQVASSLRDMQIGDLRTMTRDDILAMFGVSKHIIGVADEGGLGRATAEAHEYIFAKHYVEVELNDDANTLNEAFRRYWPNEAATWRVSFDSPVPVDKDYTLNLAENAGAVMSINERRAVLGLGPVNGGDELVDDAGNTISTKQIEAVKKATIKIKVKTKAVGPAATKSTDDNPDLKHEQKEAFRLRVQDKQTAYERRFKKIVKAFIDAQKAQVLDDLVGHEAKAFAKAMTDGNLNAAKQAEILVQASTKTFLDLLQEQGDLAIKYAGDTEKFVITEDAKLYVKQSLERASLSYNQDIIDSIGKAVTEGLKNDESLQQIGKRIEDSYSDIGGYKMTRLVRTETLKASNEATVFGYEQLGIGQKEWFANPGACSYCTEVEAMGQMSIRSTFINKGESLTDAEGNERVYDYEDVDHPPLHANCRCTVLPVRG